MTNEVPLISVSNLSFTYPHFNVVALDDVSIQVHHRDFLAIVGQNGSGKTTLVKHFNGLLRPTKGKVTVDGLDTRKRKLTVAQLSTKVGYVFQNPDRQLFADSIEKEIAFGLRNIRLPGEGIRKRIDEVVSLLGLEEYKEAYPRVLPLGVKKKINIASVLAMHPKAIVFDEPTTGQDYNGILNIMNIARTWNEQGGTVIFITHDMQLVARYAKRVAVMASGKIISEGDPATIFRNAEIMKESALKPPQVVALAESLDNYGCSKSILTVEELADWLRTRTGAKVVA